MRFSTWPTKKIESFRGKVLGIIPYFGGDTYFVYNILSILPPGDTFIEPFGGSGVVTLNAVKNDLYDRYILNDKARHIYMIYKWVRDAPERELRDASKKIVTISVRSMKDLKYRERKKKWAKQIITRLVKGKRVDPKDLYILYSAGTPSITTAGTASYLIHTRKVRDRTDRLLLTQALLRKVKISNKDAITLLKKYDRPGTVFYLDPPYAEVQKGGKILYGFAFVWSPEDASRLAKAIKGLKHASFVLKLSPEEWENYYAPVLGTRGLRFYRLKYLQKLAHPRRLKTYYFIQKDRSRTT